MRLHRAFLSAALFLSIGTHAATAFAINGDCGQPISNATGPRASDALGILKVAVGNGTCELCVCDINGNGQIQAVDALAALRIAVGQAIALNCPVCEPALTGHVRVATGESLVVGLGPGAGVTVQLFALNGEGVPTGGAISTATTNVNGKYKIRPVPDPSVELAVCATVSSVTQCAFVTSDTVDIDPVGDFLFDTVAEALGSSPADLDSLTLEELTALVELLAAVDIDFSMTTPSGAVGFVDLATGGVYSSLIAEFATSSSGPPVAVAGAYNLIQQTTVLARSFDPSSMGAPSVNARSVGAEQFTSKLSVAADGSVTHTSNLVGRAGAVTEVSGSIPGSPDTVFNASADYDEEEVDETPSAGEKLLSAAHGGLILRTEEGASAGGVAQGGGLAVVTVTEAESDAGAIAGLAFVLREGSGLSNSSLSSVYNAVQFEVHVRAETNPGEVHRQSEVRATMGTATFDGNGHFSLGATTGQEVVLAKNGAPPEAAAAAPTVSLSTDDVGEEAVSGLDYTVSSKGAVEIKEGSEVVARGATTPDRNVVVLRFGDGDANGASFGVLIATKRGTNMNKASGNGTFRSYSFDLELGHRTEPGVPDAQHAIDSRTVSATLEQGSFHLDGNGNLDVFGTLSHRSSLMETQAVLEHQMGPDEVSDAQTHLSSQTDGSESLDPEEGTYTINSKGELTANVGDGDPVQGYLSPDGNVLVFPQFETEDESSSVGLFVGLRQP